MDCYFSYSSSDYFSITAVACLGNMRPVVANKEVLVYGKADDFHKKIGKIKQGDKCSLGEKAYITKEDGFLKVKCESRLPGFIYIYSHEKSLHFMV